MSSKDVRIRIVIQTENPKLERHDEDDESKKQFRRKEFHMVELKGEEGEEEIELHEDWLPPLLSRTGDGVMLSVGQFIFIVGGMSDSIDESLESLKPPPHRRHLYYKGGAKVNLLLNQHQQIWDPLPYTNDSLIAACVPLLGKLYNFGSWQLFPKVLDPFCAGGPHWKGLLLPEDSPLHPTTLFSIPVLADPSNRRILLHSARALHAFYPEDNNDLEGGKWECLDPHFFSWPEGIVLAAHDLLFLHDFLPTSLVAYDLATQNFLDVVWSTHVDNFMYDALFSLPNQLLCFARFEFSNSSVYFLKFRAQRCPDRTTDVILTPLSLHSKVLAGTKRVVNYLPIS